MKDDSLILLLVIGFAIWFLSKEPVLTQNPQPPAGTGTGGNKPVDVNGIIKAGSDLVNSFIDLFNRSGTSSNSNPQDDAMYGASPDRN